MYSLVCLLIVVIILLQYDYKDQTNSYCVLTQQHLLTDDHSHKPIFNGKETYLDGFGKYKINRKR